MENKNLDYIKYTFSGHDSFQCRQFWLKKGYDYLISNKSFNDDDAVVKLGVGKNMVSSIRFWMKAFNIIDNKDNITDFGHSLFSDNGWDPFLEDEASLWLLHYQLVKSNIASIYYLIFNEFRKEKIVFDKEIFINYLKRRSEIEIELKINENTIADDYTVFTKLYRNSVSESNDIEDSFSGILSEIDLIKITGSKNKEQIQIENNQRDSLPEAILLFSILDNPNYGNSINLNSLEYENNSPGSIFALNRNGLINKITQIVSENKDIIFSDHAGLKELQFKNKPIAKSILDTYYGK